MVSDYATGFRDGRAAEREWLTAVRDRLAGGDAMQAHAAEYITDALNGALDDDGRWDDDGGR